MHDTNSIKSFFGFDFQISDFLLKDIIETKDLPKILHNKDKLVLQQQEEGTIVIKSQEEFNAKRGEIWEYFIVSDLHKASGVKILKTITLDGYFHEELMGKIIGNTIISEGSILRNVNIFGTNFIGKNAHIYESIITSESKKERNSAFTYIDDNVSIWSNSSITRCFIGENSKFETDVVLDSVFGKNVVFGGVGACSNQTITGDLSLMDPFTKEIVKIPNTKMGSIIGDNVVFSTKPYCMPGVLIGKNCVLVLDKPFVGTLQPGTRLISFYAIDKNGDLKEKFARN